MCIGVSLCAVLSASLLGPFLVIPPSAVAIFNGHEPLVFQYRNSNDFEIMLVFYSVFGFVLVVAFASLEFYFKHLSMCIGKIIFMNSFLDLDYMSTYLHMCAVCVFVCLCASN